MIAVATALLIIVALWAQITAHRANRKLHALRRNAFVTNEKGHRVRYSEASAAVRARVEV